MKREDGTISLMAALLVPVMLLFLAELFMFAARARQDWELARTAAAGVEAELAGYDRDLYQKFGLFAGPMDGTHAKAATLGLPYGAGLQLVAGEGPLKDNLESEILRYMKIRAPLQVISDLLKRHTGPADGGKLPLEKNSLEASMKNLTSQYDTAAPEYEVEARFLNLPDPEKQAELEAYIESNITRFYEGIVADLMPADMYEPGTSGTIDLFDPENLTDLGAVVDRLFSIPDYGVFDRLYVSEYVLSHFQHLTPILYVGTARLELKTPDGRTLAHFPSSRQLEVEQILMGGTPLQAKNRTRNAIRAIRTVVLLAHSFADTAKLGRYMGRATRVSGMITMLSGGVLTIPPEALVFLFMLYDAYSDSKAEVARLQKGFAVRFWPNAGLELYYPDYLRMLLLMQSPERLSDKIYKQINAVCPGSHYTGVRVEYASDRQTVMLDGKYRGLE